MIFTGILLTVAAFLLLRMFYVLGSAYSTFVQAGLYDGWISRQLAFVAGFSLWAAYRIWG